jgi:hypothetical protein
VKMQIKTVELNKITKATKKATKKAPKKAKKVTKPTVKKATKPVLKAPKPVVAPVVPAPVPVPVPVPAPVAAAPVKTEAEGIWDEIRFLPIQMFGLPNQMVEQHCTPLPVEPSHLYLTIRSSAALPSLESALTEYTDKMELVAKKTNTVNKSKFTVELADRFVVIARVKPSIFPPFKK